jgi:hypothetical protein
MRFPPFVPIARPLKRREASERTVLAQSDRYTVVTRREVARMPIVKGSVFRRLGDGRRSITPGDISELICRVVPR